MRIKHGIPVLLLVLCFPSDPRADALSGLGKFDFLNPGIALTKRGPEIEVSAGRNGVDGDVALLGALLRYQPEEARKEIGLEAGFTILIVEAGLSVSDRGTGLFLAPDLCLPLPMSEKSGLAMNLFYRVYPGFSGENTFGASLKVAFMRP